MSHPAEHAEHTGSFLPHGYCFEWRPDILWLNVISDIVIATAYFSIPVLLALYLKKRPDLQFRGLFFLFALFIFFCGVTHLFSIFVIWNPQYGIHGLLKAATAIVSLITAIVLAKNFDKALRIPTRAELENAIKESETQRFRSEQLELEKKSEAIFKFATELIPKGLLVIDKEQRIVLSNEALDQTFGYDAGELVGKSLSTLLDISEDHHSSLVQKYMNSPSNAHRMAAGRLVRGKRKDGGLVDIQISLSVHEYGGEKHAFAVISDVGSFINEEQQYSELSGRIIRAIEASNDGVWEWNIQSGKVWYSPRLLEMIGQGGQPAAEFGMWKNHIHPEDWPKVEQALENHLEGAGDYDISYRGLCENGNYQWFHTRGNTIFDADQKPLLMSGTLTNINHVKELEDKLRSKTDFLNEVLERSLTGLYIFDLSLQKNIYINAEYTALTGYTLPELEARQKDPNLLPLFHPDDAEAISQHFKDVIDNKNNGDEGVGIEYRFLHKDGRWRWFYSRDSIYAYDEQGKPKEMLGAFFDITALKEREAEIRKLARNYSTTFEQAGLGIAHVSLHGNFIKTNKKLRQIFGYEENEFKGLSFADVTYKEDISKGVEAIEKFKAGEISLFDIEKRYIRKDGEVFWAHLTTTLVDVIEDESPFYISIIEDISQRKEMESSLSESNAALERFAYSASHDLQEPLRKINAFSDLLEQRLIGQIDDPEARFQLNRITESASRMSEMIDNLLELSRASRAELAFSPCKFSSLLAQAKADIQDRLNSENIDISLEGDITLKVDMTTFVQILQNLIANSINYKHADRQQAIEIAIESLSNKGRIIYRDYGKGIDDDQLEEIFEPFRRLVGREIPGTGMGLAICRQLVKAHGGRIWAEQPEDGVGVKFIIEVPCVPE